MTRLNYTGRKRVTRDRVSLRLTEAAGTVSLSVERLDVGGLGVPDSARVIVEAYRQTARHRVQCGTVGAPFLPALVPLELFNVPDGVLFRVKVVGVGASDGILLASGDRIPATAEEEAGHRRSILPFQPSSDLGQRLWRLDTDDDPVLLINADVGDWKGFAMEPDFQALVYPEIVRRLALWVLENKDDAEDGDTVAGAWRRFFAALGADPVEHPPEEEEREQWVDDVAAEFARKHQFLKRMTEMVGVKETAQ